MLRSWRSRLLLVVVLLVVGSGGAQAQQREAAAGGLSSPSAFLGYPLGSQFTPHHRLVDYVRQVAARSPRATIEPYGRTYEGRLLMTAYVSAPENLRRLEEIRSNNRRRAGLQAGAPIGDPKAIVWLSYNVHGNEAVSSEAALKTLYALADPQNERTGAWLEDVVVVLDPCLNPDGRARYVQWYRSVRGRRPNARPAAREHDEPWPGGRTNHYLFDLNRDWAWGTQRETRQRLKRYHEWMPHLHVDFHEQEVDAPYYFAPGTKPFHSVITDFQHAFQRTVAQNNARYFDENDWLYFTGEVFDLFYPGYGDTWPLFNGAVGMTYEQAGSGRAGLLIERADGDTLSLRDRIAHHHTAGLSTVEVAARQAERLVGAFADYYDAAQDDPPAEHDAYVIGGENEDRARALTRLLRRQQIRYRFASEAARARGHSYRSGEEERFRVSPGDVVVPVRQPKARLAQVLFEPQAELSDSLTYDITAWALPYAFDLDAHAVEEGPSIRTTPAPPANADRKRSTEPTGNRPYAYLAEWKSLADARLLARLLKKDVRVRVAHQPFSAGGRRYDRGTLVMTRTDNEALGARFDRIIVEEAGTLDQPVQRLEGGMTAGGPDLGSSNVERVEDPQVAVLSGPSLSASSVGEVWHFFDRRLQYPATLIPTEEVAQGTFSAYDVVILPSGSYEDVFSTEEMEELRAWIRGGGRLVALGAAADFLAGCKGFSLQRKSASSDATDGSADSGTSEGRFRSYAQRQERAATRRAAGAVFRARVDDTHPLGYGYAGSYFTLKRGSKTFALLEEGWNVGMLTGSRPLSGFAGRKIQQRLRRSLVFGVEEKGTGRVIYFADDPLFRGFWQGGMLLFANAVFFVSG